MSDIEAWEASPEGLFPRVAECFRNDESTALSAGRTVSATHLSGEAGRDRAPRTPVGWFRSRSTLNCETAVQPAETLAAAFIAFL